VPMSIFMTCV